MPDILLVVDMQRGFLEPGHNLYCGDDARRVIPHIQELIRRGQSRGSHVIFTHDTHLPHDREFEIFPPHCLKGSDEWELIPELAGFAGEHLEKSRYSAFFRTNLEQRLEALRPEKITIAGVCTDICVLHTAADARNRDYPVEVPTDCVASFDPQAHQAALRHMERILGVRLTALSGEPR